MAQDAAQSVPLLKAVLHRRFLTVVAGSQSGARCSPRLADVVEPHEENVVGVALWRKLQPSVSRCTGVSVVVVGG